MGLSEYQISKSYEKYGRFVCGGFYGGLPNGKIKTFTRGGSDFSGAIVTRAIKASQYLNFTDVDGVFPFDPKIKESKPIDEISFDKIRILGEFGTTVLHPASVLPLYGTPSQIQVKNTFNKHAKGTLITQNCIKTPYAVAKKQNCSYVKIINRGKGYSTCNFMASIKKKVYCCLYALDFVEFCIEGTFSDELLREQNIDFCQIQDNVTVCYLTSSKETEKAIERIQELKLAVMINVFDYGAYIVFKEENKQEVLGIIYDN